jgi:hypothetical protein
MGFWDFVKDAASSFVEQAKKDAERTRREVERRARTTPDYQPGKKGNKVAIVVSAGGRPEERDGHPLAGQSRKPVKKLLEKAHDKDPKKFPSKDLNDVRIINVSKEVHYKKKTGDTEGRDSDNLSPANLKRVGAKLRGMETVIPLGNKPQKVVQAIVTKNKSIPEVLPGRHPSAQSLNNPKTGGYKSNKKTASERAEDRMDQFADDVLSNRRKRGK